MTPPSWAGLEYGDFRAPDKLTLRERLLRRLFPEQPFPPMPESEFILRTETVVRVGWVDRLRVLVGGWIVVKEQTITDVEVGVGRTSATFSVVARNPYPPARP